MSGRRPALVLVALGRATVRDRWLSFVGAFLALVTGTSIVVATLLALAAGLRTPFPGPQRFAAAPVVVVPHESFSVPYDGGTVDLPLATSPILPTRLVTSLSRTGPTVLDRTFDVHTQGSSGGDQVGHGWSVAHLGGYRLAAGRAPRHPDEVVFASDSTTRLGARVQIVTPSGPRDYVVAGIVQSRWFESAVFFTDRVAARLDPDVDAVAISAAPSAVRRIVENTAVVLTGSARRNADPDPSGGRDLLDGAEITLGIAASVISFVAVSVVVVTFGFVADLRRRELALLRLVGASTRQTRNLILGEAITVGVVAALLGCVLGALGGRLVGRSLVDSGIAPGWFAVGVSAWPVAAGFGVGMLSVLVGSTASAWRASRIAAIEALGDAAVDRRPTTPLRWLLGVASLIAALALATLTIRDSPLEFTNLRKTIWIPLLFVAATMLLLPVWLPVVSRWLTWPLARFGPGAMIVRANALTARRRSAAATAAVVVAIGVATTFFVLQDNATGALQRQARTTERADFSVLPRGAASVPEAALAAVRGIPAIRVTPVEQIVVYLGTRSGEFIDECDAQVVAPGSLPGAENPAVLSARYVRSWREGSSSTSARPRPTAFGSGCG